MLLKLGPVISSASGSLGGHTIQNSIGGMQLRTKPVYHTAGTAAQLSIRSINKVLQAGWRSLTIAQRSVWNNWPADHDIFNANGDKYPLSGHSLWMKFNFQWVLRGFACVTDPSVMGPPWIGPELVKNGTFSTSDYWTQESSWSISGGLASYLDTATNSMYTSLTLSCGKTYSVIYDITNCIAIAILSFRNEFNQVCFGPPLDGFINHVNGHYVHAVTCIANSSKLYLYGSIAGSVYSLDNLSIKQI